MVTIGFGIVVHCAIHGQAADVNKGLLREAFSFIVLTTYCHDMMYYVDHKWILLWMTKSYNGALE
jgi:hypothetical protein